MEYSWKRNILKYGIFRKWQSKTKAFCYKSQTLASTFWKIKHFRIWYILVYGIFWNMEKKFKNGIFLNMEYLEYGKGKRNNLFSVTKPFFIFGIWHILENGIFWNMEYSEIWNILENGIFMKMKYPKYRIFRKMQSKTKRFVISHQPYLS